MPDPEYYGKTPENFKIPLLSPVPLTENFVERPWDTAVVEDFLFSPDVAQLKPRIFILHGPTGIGKTQLAVHLMQQHVKDFSAILWLDASSDDTLETWIKRTASYIPRDHFKNTSFVQPSIKEGEQTAEVAANKLLNWLALPGNTGWLLILDNLNAALDSGPWSNHLAQIQRLGHGKVLITAQSSSTLVSAPAVSGRLGGVSDEVGVAIFKNAFGSDDLSATELKRMVEALGRLPSALVKAGQSLRGFHTPLAKCVLGYLKAPTSSLRFFLPRLLNTNLLPINDPTKMRLVAHPGVVNKDVENAPSSAMATTGTTSSEFFELLPDMQTSAPLDQENRQTYTGAMPSNHRVDVSESLAFAKGLGASLFRGSKPPEAATLKAMLDVLPDLLQGFALRIGGEKPTTAHFEVMEFIHQNQREIAKQFEQYYLPDRENIPPLSSYSSETAVGTKVGDRPLVVQQEDPNLTTSHPFARELASRYGGQADDEDGGGRVNDFQASKYRKIVLSSAAFRWLVCRMNREVDWTAAEAVAMHAVSSQIRQILYSRQENRIISSKSGPTTCEVTFESSWNPLAFVRKQQYEEEPGDALERAVVLVQDVFSNKEATLCIEYMKRTWLMCGEDVMGLIKHVMQSKPGLRCSVILFDNTRVTAWLGESGSMVLQVLGAVETIAEVGEIYSWMTVALSGADGRTEALAVPVVDIYPEGTGSEFRAVIRCMPAGPLNYSPRQCWQDLFENPRVVYGFPVRRRDSELKPGLEVSLRMLADLVGTGSFVMFGHLVLLRSFSTVVVPTGYAKGVVHWHVLFNKDETRISNTDSRIHDIARNFELAKHLTPSAIQAARHFVGWHTNVRNNAGTKGANYNVGMSTLREPDRVLTVDRITITGGMFLNFGVSASMGKIQKVGHGSNKDTYRAQLGWIREQYVVLYDCEDERAWLVDGLSALLHLVRAHLAASRKRGEQLEFEDEEFKEAEEECTGAKAAYSVLTNVNNLKLRIYANPPVVVQETIQEGDGEPQVTIKTTATWKMLPEVVSNIYQRLALLVDVQNDEAGASNVKLRIATSPRSRLEGWEFHDLACKNSDLRPKVARLPHGARGWVDLVRAINAVTLFGVGFGEILKPVSPDVCPHWVELPKKEGYLATTIDVIKKISEPNEAVSGYPFEVVSDIYWHSPGELFDKCNCKLGNPGVLQSQSKAIKFSWRKDRTQPCDRVQVLLPSMFPRLLAGRLRSPKSNPCLWADGGIIIGKSSRFPLTWKSKAMSIPEEGEPAENDISSSTSQIPESVTPPIRTEARSAPKTGTAATWNRGSLKRLLLKGKELGKMIKGRGQGQGAN